MSNIKCLFHDTSKCKSSNMADKILRSTLTYQPPSSENLIEFIKNGLQKHSEQTIIIDSKTGRQWTGKDLETIVTSIANFLIEDCGLKKGDVCTLYNEANDISALVMLGIISAGGTCNYLTDSNRAREVLDTSKTLNVKFIIARNELLERIKPDFQDNENINVVSCDNICEGFKNGCKTLENFLTKDIKSNNTSFDDLIAKLKINVDTDFPIMQFSSGTTGKPKPIPRTHKNLCHLIASVDHEELMNLKPGQVIAGSLSLTHRPGLWCLLACVNGGSTWVMWDNLSDVEEALSVIAKYKVTIFSSSLPFLSMLGNHGVRIKDKFDLSSLEHIITSGAKIVHPELPKSVIEAFKLKSLRQCFGMTESGWVFLIENSLAKDNYLSVGHVVPSMEAIVMDQVSQAPLEPEVRGEIALRGPQIFPGYLTDKHGVFNRGDFTESGWFRTGDQGYYDKDGLVFIEGRYKELLMFANNGRAFPNEIEAIISEHPAIEGVCVVKIGEYKKEISYDIARAYVTMKHGFSLTEKEVLDFLDQRSCDVMLNGGVRFLDKFPRLSNGKVNKQLLKSMQ